MTWHFNSSSPLFGLKDFLNLTLFGRDSSCSQLGILAVPLRLGVCSGSSGCAGWGKEPEGAREALPHQGALLPQGSRGWDQWPMQREVLCLGTLSQCHVCVWSALCLSSHGCHQRQSTRFPLWWVQQKRAYKAGVFLLSQSDQEAPAAACFQQKAASPGDPAGQGICSSGPGRSFLPPEPHNAASLCLHSTPQSRAKTTRLGLIKLET